MEIDAGNRVWNKVKGKTKRFFLPLVASVLIACVPKPSYALFCDACVVAAITTEDADLSALLATEDFSLTYLITSPFGLPGIMLALFGPTLLAAPGIDVDMNTGFSQIVNSLDTLTTSALPMHANIGADAIKYYGDVQGIANIAPDAIVSQQSTHCATTYSLQGRSAMDGFIRSATLASMKIVRDRDTGASTGPGVPAPSPVNALLMRQCEVAPFRTNGTVSSSRNGTAAATAISNCATTDATGASALPNELIDADLDMGSVFDRLQVTIPSIQTAPVNGHVHFTPQSDEEWQYVAAWRFCEHFIPATAPPPNSVNGSVSFAEQQRAVSNDTMTTYKLPAIMECMQALNYRAACPQATQGSFKAAPVGGGAAMPNCWQTQDITCHRLTDPAPGGLGITDVGNQEANTALANCDTNGFSPAMFDYVWAHRCADGNYMSKTIPQEYADARNIVEERNACLRDRASMDVKLHQQKQNFITAIDMFMQANPGAQPNSGATPAYPN